MTIFPALALWGTLALSATSLDLDLDQATARDGLPRLEPAVLEALEAAGPAGRVNVVVRLEAPELAPATELALRQEQVFALQAEVLSSLPEGSLELVYRFRNVPGLIAWVDERGLKGLLDSAAVANVGRDVPGRKASLPLLGTSADYVGAPDVHASGTTGAGCTIAVIDSGIDTNHPDLADDVASGAFTFLSQSGGGTSPGAEDDDGHGTHVSGIITADGSSASIGVAPNADILAIKVLDSNGQGFVGDWTAGVDYVISVKDNYNDLCAINLSLETFDTYGGCPCDGSTIAASLMHIALQTARDCGIPSFAATGNDGECFRMTYPGCDSATEAVGAVYEGNHGSGSAFGCSDNPASADLLTCFTNQNPCIRLAAPGYRITSSWIGGGTQTQSGTSFAAPHCSAGAALLRETDPSLTPDLIGDLLYGTGVETTRPCGQTPSRRIRLVQAVAGTASASAVVRLGSPPNPDALRPGQTGGPVLGTTWDPFVDHASFVPNSVFDYLAITFEPVNFPLPSGAGTLLLLLAGGQTTAIASPGSSFQVVVPNDFGLAGMVAVAQAASFPGPGVFLLTNALDLVIGYQ